MFTSDLTRGWWRERNVSESTVGYRRWKKGDIRFLCSGLTAIKLSINGRHWIHCIHYVKCSGWTNVRLRNSYSKYLLPLSLEERVEEAKGVSRSRNTKVKRQETNNDGENTTGRTLLTYISRWVWEEEQQEKTKHNRTNATNIHLTVGARGGTARKDKTQQDERY